jgi:photosynthesis system II assembly factor YCF48-like protein
MQELPKIVLDRLSEDRLREDGVAEAHPEADTLTALVEHSLADSERSRVLEHIARCTDCREIVTLALPATETVAIATTSARVRDRWFNWPVLGWGAVAVGIIAVASIGMLQHWQRTLNTETLPTLAARNEMVGTAQNSQPSPGSFEHQAVLPQMAGRQVQVRKRVSPNPEKKVTAASAARTSPPRTGPQFVVPPSSQMVEAQTAEAATVATAQSRISDQLIQKQKATNSDVVKAKAPTSLEATSGGVSAQTLEPSNISSLQTTSAVVSASPSWTISSSGVLRRSFDAGNTWEDVNVNRVADAGASKGSLAGADEKAADEKANGNDNEKKVRNEIGRPSMVFRAVTALGSEVWAGGARAILYHSTDSGTHWVRVLPSSASTVLTGDITVIEFSDPQHGSVVTSYGEVWITADSGQTWTLQP